MERSHIDAVEIIVMLIHEELTFKLRAPFPRQVFLSLTVKELSLVWEINTS